MLNFLPARYDDAFGSIVFMLGLFATIGLFITLFTNKKDNKLLRKLQEDERNANMVNTTPLPDDIIFHINIAPLKLDLINYSSLDPLASKRIEKLIKSITAMNNLSFVYNDHTADNLSIKEKYGPVTLKKYIELEHVYNTYTQKLNDLTKLLYDNHLFNEATTIALELFNLHSSISSSYIVLSDIYFANNDFNRLNKLKNSVETADFFSISEYSRKKVLNHIDKLLWFLFNFNKLIFFSKYTKLFSILLRYNIYTNEIDAY